MLVCASAIADELKPTLPGVRGDDGVRRLTPSTWPRLPEWLARSLRNASCEIPQFGLEIPANNIVSGRFLVATRIDWAVVCSAGGSSTLLIFSRALNMPVEVQAAKPDALGVYDTGYGWEYSEVIGRISARVARAAARRHDDELPKPIRADGVLICLKEAACSAHFWHERKWVVVATSD